MKLSLRQALELLGALKALDGYDHVIKANGSDAVVRKSYKLSGELRKAIRRNINRLTPEVSAHNEALEDKFKELSGGRTQMDPKDDAYAIAVFTQETNSMLKLETEELELVPLDEDALLVEDNPIPGTVLAGLAPVLK